MLISAAAPNERSTRTVPRGNGSVFHTLTQRKLPSPASRRASVSSPRDPPLKPRRIHPHRQATGRTDAPAKVSGQAKFGIDTRIPGMLVASIERCPVYGGTPRSFNADR